MVESLGSDAEWISPGKSFSDKVRNAASTEPDVGGLTVAQKKLKFD